MVDSSPKQTIHKAGLAGGLILGAAVPMLFAFDQAHPETGRTAGVAVLMAVWWMTGAIPLAATSLVPVVLFPLLGIMDGKKVSAEYFNWVIFLFLGGFLLAGAIEKWNLHKRIALRILILFGVRPKGMLLGFMSATAFISMLISNTATTMMMMPIALALIVKFEDMAGKDAVAGYSRSLMLGLAYASSIGGVATLVGTPPNPVFLKIFSMNFPSAPEISFAKWLLFAFPISLLFLLFTWLYLSHINGLAEMRIEGGEADFREQYAKLGPMTYEEKICLTASLLIGALWMFRADLELGPLAVPGWSALFPFPGYINDGTVAILVSLSLFLIPSRAEPSRMILGREAVPALPWNIVLLFGGGFALAAAFQESGLSAWLGMALHSVGSYHPLLIVVTICLMSTFLTELTSNTATAQILLPIFASLSTAIGVNPMLIMIPATISFSFAFMLPVATPPNAIVFGSGRLSVADMAKAGLVLNLVGAALLAVAMLTMGRLVFGIDIFSAPDWFNAQGK